jgi:hypothetical protein
MMGYDGWKCSIPRPLPSQTSEQYAEVAVIPTMKQGRYYPATASDKYSLYVIGEWAKSYEAMLEFRYLRIYLFQEVKTVGSL